MWSKIAECNDKHKIKIEHLVETTWLTIFIWPTEIMNDQRSELIAHEFRKSYLKENTGYYTSQAHRGIQLSMKHWKEITHL